jgi:hypothetical protein
MPKLTVEMTYEEAKAVWGIVNGAVDAGACPDGLSDLENEGCEKLETALLKFMAKHKAAAMEGEEA